MTTQPASDVGGAARLLVDQMQRERQSFWSILGVFFLLLAGIGGMIIYQMLELKSLAEDARTKRFETIGEQSFALSSLRTQQNDGAVAQRDALEERMAAQEMTAIALQAARATPQALAKDAERFARDHFLGRSLNQSTAVVVTGALDGRQIPASQRALLSAAFADWNMPDRMTASDLTEALPKVEANARTLLADPMLAYFGHAALAAYHFRRANSAAVYMDWDKGCKELVEEASAALALGDPALAEGADPEAAGLNLHYWRGQCFRRHGEPEKARADFEMMMRLAKSDKLSGTNPLKFQSYHGIGTVLATLLDEAEKTPEERAKDIAEAIVDLKAAGDYRVQAGMTEVGKVSSTGNIGFLYLKENTPEGLVKTLEYTGQIDEIQASTWNLVARLVAARALQQDKADLPAAFMDEGLKANDAALREKYSKDGLDEVVFQTLAKLAYQRKSSLPKVELSKLLDPAHHPALDEADRCIEQRAKCYQDIFLAKKS